MFKVNVVLFTFDALAGGIIALWKSVVITVKVEIGGAAAQIELREVTDKRRLEHTLCVKSLWLTIVELLVHNDFLDVRPLSKRRFTHNVTVLLLHNITEQSQQCVPPDVSAWADSVTTRERVHL